MQYYVYSLTDPTDNKIKYIGKGTGRRMFRHWNEMLAGRVKDNNWFKYRGLKEIYKSNLEVKCDKLFETDDEKKAYEKEEELMLKYNTLAPNGWNITLPFRKLSNHSDETKLKMSESAKKRGVSYEHILLMAQKNIGNKYNLGRKMSDKTRAALSSANKGKKQSEDHIRKRVESITGTHSLARSQSIKEWWRLKKLKIQYSEVT